MVVKIFQYSGLSVIDYFDQWYHYSFGSRDLAIILRRLLEKVAFHMAKKEPKMARYCAQRVHVVISSKNWPTNRYCDKQ